MRLLARPRAQDHGRAQPPSCSSPNGAGPYSFHDIQAADYQAPTEPPAHCERPRWPAMSPTMLTPACLFGTQAPSPHSPCREETFPAKMSQDRQGIASGTLERSHRVVKPKGPPLNFPSITGTNLGPQQPRTHPRARGAVFPWEEQGLGSISSLSP